MRSARCSTIPTLVGGLRDRRRRGGNRAARDRVAFEQVSQSRDRRRGAADPASERLQDRQSDPARAHHRARSWISCCAATAGRRTTSRDTSRWPCTRRWPRRSIGRSSSIGAIQTRCASRAAARRATALADDRARLAEGMDRARKFIDGRPIEGTFRSHQVPLTDPATNPAHLEQLEEWLRSYRPQELFDERRAGSGPSSGRWRPRATGAWERIRTPTAAGCCAICALPDFADYARRGGQAGHAGIGDTHVLGRFLRDVASMNAGAAQFPNIRPGRDAVERPGGGVSRRRTASGRRPIAENDEFLAPHRPGDGNAERAPMRGMAGGVPAHRPARPVQLLRGIHPHRRFDVQSAREVAEGHRGAAVARARSPRSTIC